VTWSTSSSDAMSMHLITPARLRRGGHRDTFGDILTDESSVITGSLGMLPSGPSGQDQFV